MVMFESKQNLFDSAQCQAARNLNPRSVSQRGVTYLNLFREYLHKKESFCKTILAVY